MKRMHILGKIYQKINWPRLRKGQRWQFKPAKISSENNVFLKAFVH